MSRVLHKFARLLGVMAVFPLALPAHPSMAGGSDSDCDSTAGLSELAIIIGMAASHDHHQKGSKALDCCDLFAMDTCAVQSSGCCAGLAGAISAGEPIHAPPTAAVHLNELLSALLDRTLSTDPPPPRL